jgi:hypothetical protein
MGEGVKYPAPTPTLKDSADQVEVRKAFSDLSRVLEKKIVGEKTGSDPARGLYVENTEGPNAQEIAAPGTIPIRDDNGALPGNITGNAPTATLAANAVNATAADTVATANEAADATCFPLFVPSATGQQEPKTNANLTFDAATGILGFQGFASPNGVSADGRHHWEITGNGLLHIWGWGYFTGSGGADTSITLTFERAFKAGTLPHYFHQGLIGYKAGSNPSNQADITGIFLTETPRYGILSNTQALVGCRSTATTAATVRILYTYYAIGEA